MDELTFPIPMAFYGSLMRGLGGVEELGIEDSLHFISPCEIPGWLMDLGEYPGLLPGAGRVLGELFEITHPEALALLDRFEGFEPGNHPGSLYIRKEVQLIAPDRRAWVYLYNREVERGCEVRSGNWRAHSLEREGKGRA